MHITSKSSPMLTENPVIWFPVPLGNAYTSPHAVRPKLLLPAPEVPLSIQGFSSKIIPTLCLGSERSPFGISVLWGEERQESGIPLLYPSKSTSVSSRKKDTKKAVDWTHATDSSYFPQDFYNTMEVEHNQKKSPVQRECMIKRCEGRLHSNPYSTVSKIIQYAPFL